MDSLRHLDRQALSTLLERSEALHLSDVARRRLACLLYAVEQQKSIEQTSEHFGIAPSTLRRWLKHFDPQDPSTLEEQSRRPHRLRKSDVEERVIQLIEGYRRQHPTMGQRKIQKKLKQEHGIELSPSTIFRIIDQYHLFFGNTLSHREKRQQKADASGDQPAPSSWAMLALLLVFGSLLLGIPVRMQAAGSDKLQNAYHGQLLDGAGQPVTTPSNIRMSLWKSADSVTGDVTSTGAINTAATLYGGWYEEKTIVPDSNGGFVIFMGTGTQLPDIHRMSYSDAQSLYIQIEAKAVSSPQTSYELLDPDSTSATLDRTSIFAFRFIRSSGDFSEENLGTGSGSLARYGSGGVLPVSQGLSFGDTLQKTLTYDVVRGRFAFNDDVFITGDLTVSGRINGADFGALAPLRVSSGAGLTVQVASGSYRLNGTITNFLGSGSVVLSPNTTNYLFFGSGGLIVRTVTFPTDESYIPLATVTTSATSVTGVTERRVLQNDDRERTVETQYHAGFEHAAFQGDATNNVGQLYIDHDTINLRNFYRWTSSPTTLQDYDVILRETLPPGFVRWNSGSIVVRYRSTSSSTANNKLDISVFDTNGSPVTLTGGSTDLANTSWSTTTLNFGGSPTWTAGQDFLVKFKLSAKDNFQMHLGDVKFTYVDFAP